MTTAALSIQNVSKHFGKIRAVDDVSFDVSRGEFFSLLGPSGSGKTTLLRIIAGLETPGKGAVHIGGRDVTRLPPYARGIGMVFQDFLLFPHKTVGENIAFPLKMQGMPADKKKEQLDWVVSLVRMEGLEDRFPHQLSGGQKQRVALARGLVSRPEVLLLDEPLANLDRELRKEMEVEMRRFQSEIDIPFVYVTHNQEEALTLSTRMAVMNNGRFDQVGFKLDLYHHPDTAFVASFLGATNHIRGKLTRMDDRHAHIDWDGLDLTVPLPADTKSGDRVDYYLKSEKLGIQVPGETVSKEDINHITGKLRDIIFQGRYSDYFVMFENGHELIVSDTAHIPSVEIGKPIEIIWPINAGDAFKTKEEAS
ncbi:MAG: ABC transporter ATP-binding protein [Deltaproteobacteria bacterium]|nr:MAG: ABC transporter ATP-binding protein [Deltaproteobacteria bacterium]